MKAGGERARSVPGLPKGSRLRKWRCPCGVIVRVASDDLRATCNRCLGEFARDHSVYGPNRNMARYGPRNRKEGGMMRLVYLVPNVSWVFLFGDAPTRLDGEPLFYRTRSEALAAAERKGLQVDKRGRVSALSSNAGEGTNG